MYKTLLLLFIPFHVPGLYLNKVLKGREVASEGYVGQIISGEIGKMFLDVLR